MLNNTASVAADHDLLGICLCPACSQAHHCPTAHSIEGVYTKSGRVTAVLWCPDYQEKMQCLNAIQS